MKTILNVCRKVKDISDEELAEAEEMAKGQTEFISPLRMATTGKQHALGNHNLRVLKALRELRDVIRSGEKIAA